DHREDQAPQQRDDLADHQLGLGADEVAERGVLALHGPDRSGGESGHRSSPEVKATIASSSVAYLVSLSLISSAGLPQAATRPAWTSATRSQSRSASSA